MDEFLEPNLAVASFLRTKGYKLDRFAQIGRTKLAFIFSDHDGRAGQVAESYSRGATAPAELLLSNFGDLKQAMYEKKLKLQGEQNAPTRNSPLTTTRK